GVEAALAYIGRTSPVVNLPGCPTHPDWFVGTVSYILVNGTMPPLDSDGRPNQDPVNYFGQSVETHCIYDPDGPGKAKVLGQSGCLKRLGCKGSRTYADCPSRKWNSPGVAQEGVNWCIQARTPCHGCTEPDFPDGMTPFHTKW
ncbi:MAG: iron hydrogenase, partial [Planctomycetes bacterium]|nr:iron hydrogenase [Planctomycetota bacterium]